MDSFLTEIVAGLAVGGAIGGDVDTSATVGPGGPGSVDRLEAQRIARHAESFNRRLDGLALVCVAMWSLLKDKTGLTEEDLLERVRQIDLADGQQDGAARRNVAKCPQCGRSMSSRHKRCLYCGAENLVYTAFDAVL